MAHNWYAECAKCGKWKLKREMQAIKVGNYNPKHLCWLCDGCFAAMLDELEVSM